LTQQLRLRYKGCIIRSPAADDDVAAFVAVVIVAAVVAVDDAVVLGGAVAVVASCWHLGRRSHRSYPALCQGYKTLYFALVAINQIKGPLKFIQASLICRR